MSDFDERLSAVLTAEAEHAPHPAALAQAARRRHVVRRRRRIAAGSVVAALAIAGPALLLASGGSGDDRTASDPTPPPQEWQTVTHEDARAEIPGDWRKHTCDFDGFESEIYGPSEEDACGFGTYLAFYGSATFDPANMPGEITGTDSFGGYVYAGDWAVSSSTPDRDLTRRVLASARVNGQPQIDAGDWQSSTGIGLRVDIPADWGLGPDVGAKEYSKYAVCSAPGDLDDRPEVDGRPSGPEHPYFVLDHRDGRWISVSAPTQAVGDLVMASVEMAGDGGIGCLPLDRFTR
jgi:hypothetical protein